MKSLCIILFILAGNNLFAQSKPSARRQIQNHLETLSDSLTFRQVEDDIYKLNPEKVWKSKPGICFFLTIGVLAFLSSVLMLKGLRIKEGKLIQPKRVYWWDGFIYAFWVVAPPLWFLIEYIWLFDDKYKMHSDYSNDVKFVQDLGRNAWAALFVLHSSILYLKYAYKSNTSKPHK